MAVAIYNDEHKHLPPAYLVDVEGKPQHSWRVLLLPFIEHQNVHAAYRFAEPWDSPANQALAEKMPRMYALPPYERQPGYTTANYLAVVGRETVWPGRDTLTLKDVADGASNTILLGENDGMNVPWLAPRDLELATMSLELDSPDGISSPYHGPAVAMLDFSVRHLSKDLPPEVLRAMLTARGGEAVHEDAGGWKVIPDGRQRELKKR
jgi:hypothetical protein